jgi:hypothetical protein
MFQEAGVDGASVSSRNVLEIFRPVKVDDLSRDITIAKVDDAHAATIFCPC